MPMSIGATPITGMYLGPDEVTAVYLGPDLVWSRTSIYQTFDVAAAGDLTALGWQHYGPSTAYKIGVNSGVARYAVTDGFGTLGYFTDRVRYTEHVAPGDNGYIQMKVASVGSGDDPFNNQMITDVFCRGSNTDVTHGVGLRYVNSTVGIVRRVAGTDALITPLGSFAAGDILRLQFNGNLYTATRNGAFVGEWQDTGGTASVGVGFRSLLMRMNGQKSLNGDRRFSPGIDYVEYG